MICDKCGRDFPRDKMITYGEYLICLECREALDKLDPIDTPQPYVE